VSDHKVLLEPSGILSTHVSRQQFSRV